MVVKGRLWLEGRRRKMLIFRERKYVEKCRKTWTL
jgi:hypothetical protein